MTKKDNIPLTGLREIADGYFQLIRTGEDITWVSCQIWWSGLSTFDGKVKLAYNKSAGAPYVDIPTLEFTMDNEDGDGGGTCTLTHTKYEGYSVALYIDKGTEKNGIINTTIYTSGRKE